MPFDEEDDDSLLDKSKKIGLKNVSTQKSMFDTMPKKPSQEDFEKKVQAVHQQAAAYKHKAAELAVQFKKMVEDKTLPENRNMFSIEMEREILSKMVQLAIDINNDPNEQEGMGSLSWITLLFKTILAQRDRINHVEYKLFQLEKKLEKNNLSFLIKQELQELDKKS